MRTERGKEIFAALVPHADIVLQNFRPGIMEKMGFGYEELCRLKRDIILVSVSGFGQYGPYRDRPAFDPLGQAMSGLMVQEKAMRYGRPRRGQEGSSLGKEDLEQDIG